MRTTCGTIVAVAAAVALGESALAGLPPHANSSVTNAAAVMEAKTFVGKSGDSLNYRIFSPERVESLGTVTAEGPFCRGFVRYAAPDRVWAGR